MAMKMTNRIFSACLWIAIMSATGLADMKKVAQSGMTFLAVSLGARESAMADASVAAVEGVQGLMHNPGAITELSGFGLTFNQVKWIADTDIYGVGIAYGSKRFGTLGLDVVYMDYGTIIGTQRVDKSINSRGFAITGGLNVDEYAVGLAYAYPVSDRFSFGAKVKYIHEDLGTAPIAVTVIDPENSLFGYETREWALNHWGFDFGARYKIGFRNLVFAVAFQNYSTDMKYWAEEFTLPLVLRMGLAMDLAKIFWPENETIAFNTAVDALHPNDYTERVHLGAEFVYLNMFSLRGGYKFNYDVENFSFGLGFKFDLSGYTASIDYAYTNAEYFGHIDRFSMRFAF